MMNSNESLLHTVALYKKAPCLKSGIAIEEKVSDGLQDLAQGDTKTLLGVLENGGTTGHGPTKWSI
jgi:hypothetical protein